MVLVRYIIRPMLHLRHLIEKTFRLNTFGRKKAVFTPQGHDPDTKTDPHLIKHGLHAFHVKQFHESACSAATIASVINTLMNRQSLLKGGQPVEHAVTQQDLLEKVSTAHWKERMSDAGHRGRRGLPLDMLGKVVRASLDACRVEYKTIETVQAPGRGRSSRQVRKTLLARLHQFEARRDCILIAHFDQGSFLPELHIPHISPVGGFDPARSAVKILDVDNTVPHPYEVDFDTFYKGISTDYLSLLRWFGYAEGGYVFIQV